MATAKTAAPAAPDTAKHPYVRVVAPSTDRATECAGQLWAGISEVPRATLSELQLAALKADKQLTVEEFERPHVEA